MAKKQEDQKKVVKKKVGHALPKRHKPDLIESPQPTGKRGRPTKFNPTLAKRILFLISTGNSLLSIEKMDGMPARTTVLDWYYSQKYPNFNKLYDEAREKRAEFIFEEAKEISDDIENKIVGDDKSDGARVQAQKIRIETRKWFTSVLAPRKFAESSRIDVTSGGKKIKEARPVTINYTVPAKKP